MEIILDLQYQHLIQLPLTVDDMNRLPGSSWINIFYDNARALGYDVLLSRDVIASRNIKGALLISEMFTEYTSKLIRMGAIPFLVFSQESPNISKAFYKNYSTKHNFRNTYLFPGAFNFFGRFNNSIDLFWPNSTFNIPETRPPKEIFLGMIASNKQIFNKRFNFVPTRLEQLIKRLVWRKYYKMLDYNGYKDLYRVRLDAIDYFSDCKDFSLFGRGWGKKNTLTNQLFNKINKIKPLEISNKFEVLSKMKFSICFENFKFPGYITEKIFDCFLTGSIPIYLGAPDIERYVPTESFIDARKFSSFKDIEAHIRGLSINEISGMHDAALKFLKSPDYCKFTDKLFAKNILDLVINSSA